MGVPPESENESPRCAAKTALSPGAGPLLGAAPQACASALPYPASRLPRLSGLWGVLTRHPQHVISWGHLCFGPSIGQGPGVGVTGGPLQDTGGGLSTLRASVRTPRVTGLPALVLLERRTPPPRPTSDVLPGPLALHVAYCLVLFRPRVSSVRTRGGSRPFARVPRAGSGPPWDRSARWRVYICGVVGRFGHPYVCLFQCHICFLRIAASNSASRRPLGEGYPSGREGEGWLETASGANSPHVVWAGSVPWGARLLV